MRIIFVALLLVCSACSKTQPTSETDTESEAAPAAAPETPEAEAPAAPKAPPTAPEPEPETIPIVKLTDAGKAPLEALRRTFEKGQKETMSLEVGEVIAMKGGGWDMLRTPLALDQTIDLETVAVSKDGVAEVTLTVREAKEVEGSVEAPNTRQMNPTGVTGRFKIDAQGVMTELALDPPPNNPKIQKPFLDSMRSKLRWMAPPFPKEPVGVGAKWTVTTEVNEFLTRLQEKATVELVERTGSEIVLRFEVESTGTRHHDFTPPQDITVDVQVDGQAEVDPSKVVPSSSKLNQQVVQNATILGPDAPDEPTVQTLSYEVKVLRK